jgi:hypothetical protein
MPVAAKPTARRGSRSSLATSRAAGDWTCGGRPASVMGRWLAPAMAGSSARVIQVTRASETSCDTGASPVGLSRLPVIGALNGTNPARTISTPATCHIRR